MKTCEICGKEFTKEQLYKKDRRYCSNSCSGIARKNKKRPEEVGTRISKALLGKSKSEAHKKKLSEAHKNKVLSKEHKNNISKGLNGRSVTNKTRQKISATLKGKKHSEERKRNIQIGVSNYFVSKKGSRPNYNIQACKYFKKFDEENNTKGRYAVYGEGEYYIKEIARFPDYINFDLKIIMEWDEKAHYVNGELRKKDVERQKEIQRLFFDYKFIRIKEWLI